MHTVWQMTVSEVKEMTALNPSEESETKPFSSFFSAGTPQRWTEIKYTWRVLFLGPGTQNNPLFWAAEVLDTYSNGEGT